MKIFISLVILALLHSSKCYNDILVSSMDSSQGITLSSQLSNGAFGSYLRSAGDFNGDGYDDVIIGAFGANLVAGETYVVFGSASGLSNLDVSSGMAASQGMVIKGKATGDQLGCSLSNAGDINDDGIDDIIIGALEAQGGKGVVYVIYGSETLPPTIDLATGLDQSQGFIVIGGGSLDNLGVSVSYAGDVNNDKIDDVIIGASGAEGNKGAYYVIFGKKGARSQLDLASGLSSSEGFVIIGPSTAADLFGKSVSNAGDLDGDGVGDLILGAYGADNHKGAVYIIYGKSTFATIDLGQGLDQSVGFTIVTGKPGTPQLGYSVRSAGDFNGDGRIDVIVGAHGENTLKGAAYVIFGMGRSSLLNIDLTSGIDPDRGIRIAGTNAMEILGMSVSGAGDVNNDGIDDIIVSAPRGSGTAGTAYVIFGSKTFGSSEIVPANGLAPNEGFSIIGINPDDFLGFSADCAGDVNGNGMPDVIVGAHGVNVGTGAAYLLFSPRKRFEKGF